MDKSFLFFFHREELNAYAQVNCYGNQYTTEALITQANATTNALEITQRCVGEIIASVCTEQVNEMPLSHTFYNLSILFNHMLQKNIECIDSINMNYSLEHHCDIFQN